ncbi:hypothetical protein PSTG_15033 [Puccinia striiformis f. sp. tritici PST-78]|uniref:Uncharacterized protein n=1 Tax=Puccinia striiformis f. sp. tritici PST-78 TaxID=1165861 RepID=A0A0L0UWY0_9BASI|nr:hypothetical protein PSTG_15033 [Puccinia striiformis f. sp. tritici PST-78]
MSSTQKTVSYHDCAGTLIAEITLPEEGCVQRPDVLGIHTGIIRKHSPDTNPHANRDPVGRRCLHKFWHWSSSRQQVESIADERDMARWGEPKRNCLVGNGGNPIGLIMVLEIGAEVRDSNLIVWTDNTTTESVLSARKSRDKYVNEEWKEIQHMLIKSEIDLMPKRVKSEDNVAHGLLQGVVALHAASNRVWFVIPGDLTEFMFHA